MNNLTDLTSFCSAVSYRPLTTITTPTCYMLYERTPMQDHTTALVHLPGEIKTYRPNAQEGTAHEPVLDINTPFGIFMRTLMVDKPASVTTMAGSQEWRTAPIEKIIAVALWAIILRLADKLRLSSVYEDEIFKLLTPRITRALELGMYTKYGSPKKAAQAFEKQIMSQLPNLMAKASSVTTCTLQQALDIHASAFFADMIRSVTETHRHLQAKLADFERKNSFLNQFQYFRRDVNIGTACRYIDMEMLNVNLNWQKYPNTQCNFALLLRIDEQFAVFDLGLRTLSKLPVRIHDFKNTSEERRRSEDAISIDYEWMCTQLLLSVTNEPAENGSVGSEKFRHLIIKLKTLTADEMIRLFMRRMQKRDVTQSAWTSEELAFLHNLIRSRFTEITSIWDENYPNLHVIVHYEFTKGHKYTQLEALQVALNENEGPKGLETYELPAMAAKKIGRTIPWADIDLGMLYDFLRAEKLPAYILASGIGKMRKDLRKHALAMLFEEHTRRTEVYTEFIDCQTVEVLLKNRLLKLDDPFIWLHPELVPDSYLEQYLLLLTQATESQISTSWVANRYLPAIEKLEPSRAKEFLTQPKIRPALVKMLSQGSRAVHGITDEQYKNFLKILGQEMWIHYVLAEKVYMREEGYKTTEATLRKSEFFETHPKWTIMEDAKEKIFRPSYFLHLPRAKVRKLLKQPAYSEVAMFRWLHAADKHVEKKLKLYLANRAEYYRKVARIFKKR